MPTTPQCARRDPAHSAPGGIVRNLLLLPALWRVGDDDARPVGSSCCSYDGLRGRRQRDDRARTRLRGRRRQGLLTHGHSSGCDPSARECAITDEKRMARPCKRSELMRSPHSAKAGSHAIFVASRVVFAPVGTVLFLLLSHLLSP
jgi:hypothetical protein